MIVPPTTFMNPTWLLISYGVKKIVESINQKDSSTPTLVLKEESEKAEIQACALLAQAKVEQELAISRRIHTADEVEIEEFYDVSGKGHGGVKADGDSVSLGLGGEGRRVTRRIIKFKGGATVVPTETTDDA